MGTGGLGPVRLSVSCISGAIGERETRGVGGVSFLDGFLRPFFVYSPSLMLAGCNKKEGERPVRYVLLCDSTFLVVSYYTHICVHTSMIPTCKLIHFAC